MHPLNLEGMYLSAVSEVHYYQCLCLPDGWRVFETTFIGSNTILHQLEKWIKLSPGTVLLFYAMLVLLFSYNFVALSSLLESDIAQCFNSTLRVSGAEMVLLQYCQPWLQWRYIDNIAIHTYYYLHKWCL